jgi:hypothetical protein
LLAAASVSRRSQLHSLSSSHCSRSSIRVTGTVLAAVSESRCRSQLYPSPSHGSRRSYIRFTSRRSQLYPSHGHGARSYDIRVTALAAISESRRSQLYPGHVQAAVRRYILVSVLRRTRSSYIRVNGTVLAAIISRPVRVSVLAAISESRCSQQYLSHWCRSLRLASISESQCSRWQLNPSPGPPRRRSRSSEDSLPGMALAAVISDTPVTHWQLYPNHGMFRRDRSRAIRVTVLAAAFRVMVLAAVPASHGHSVLAVTT